MLRPMSILRTWPDFSKHLWLLWKMVREKNCFFRKTLRLLIIYNANYLKEQKVGNHTWNKDVNTQKMHYLCAHKMTQVACLFGYSIHSYWATLGTCMFLCVTYVHVPRLVNMLKNKLKIKLSRRSRRCSHSFIFLYLFFKRA